MRKELGLQRRNMYRKGKNAVESDPKKVGVGLKWSRELSKGLGWRLAWWGSNEKEGSNFLGHQYSQQRSNRNRAPCVASTAVGTEGEEDLARQIVSIEQLTEEGREAGRLLMKREKYRAKNGSLQNT